MSRPVQLGRAGYRDKVHACWLGKNIGGTLGAPYECHKQVQQLTFYDPLPDQSDPNDDLDLQLAWLQCLEDRGVHITCGDLADYWIRCLSAYPWNEYGFCRRNLGRGLRPPVSGCFENYYIDEMGSPIRSEIWACVAPRNVASHRRRPPRATRRYVPTQTITARKAKVRRARRPARGPSRAGRHGTSASTCRRSTGGRPQSLCGCCFCS